MNSLDQLLRQSNILLEIIDELIELIKKPRDNESDYNKNEMIILTNTIKKTLDVAKSFMENYNEFIKDQFD